MTQKQQIDLLNSIMPEIVSTKNPEQVMLKCAKAHKLAPAQLEKLAQVFNTTKTLVGLEKQANRGDSFGLINVPDLVASYTTYSPADVLSSKSQKVHKQVDKLMKYADDSTMRKSASTVAVRNTLPAFGDVATFVENSFTEFSPTPVNRDDDVVFNKEASDARAAREYKSTKGQLDQARDMLKQVQYETAVEMTKLASDLREKFLFNPEAWAEAVEDVADGFGMDKLASAVNFVQDYFKSVRFRYTPANLTKRAFARPLVMDRHNVYNTFIELAQHAALNKQATAQLAELEATFGKQASGSTHADIDADGPIGRTISNNLEGFRAARPLVDSSGFSGDGLGVVRDAYKGTFEALDTITGKNMRSGEKKEQKQYDALNARADMEKTIQHLVLADKTIQDADPKAVNDIFQTVASISPTFARDPRKMAPVLKEALQYDAVPLHMLSELAKFEETIQKTNEKTLDVDQIRYNSN